MRRSLSIYRGNLLRRRKCSSSFEKSPKAQTSNLQNNGHRALLDVPIEAEDAGEWRRKLESAKTFSPADFSLFIPPGVLPRRLTADVFEKAPPGIKLGTKC